MNGTGPNQTFKWDLKEKLQFPIEHESIPLSRHDGGSDQRSLRISSTDEMLIKMSPGFDKWHRNRSRSPRIFNHHHSSQHFEERRYLNTNYVMNHPFGAGRMPGDGMLRARENGSNIRGSSSQQVGWHGPRKFNATPCKYFARGNCWKGKDCRFSHQSQGYNSSKVDCADQSRNPKLCSTSLVPEAMLSEENLKKQASEPRFGTWSNDCEPKHNLEQNNTELKGTDSLLGDLQMSHEWNYKVQPPKQAGKEESHSISQISQSPNPCKTSLATEIPPIQNTVSSNKQLQISNMRASLTQLFENKDQLQQVHTALNPQKSMENMSQKLCDPRVNSIEEQVKTGISPPLFSSNTIIQINISDGAAMGLKEREPKENKKGEARTDEEKKRLVEKRICALKFALVEFVKECLDPLWKDSQIKKDDYKAIVKKVADKVIGTVQGAQIPETKEHIDQYLSVSKLKITKLVEAYVEKYQQMKKMEACL